MQLPRPTSPPAPRAPRWCQRLLVPAGWRHPEPSVPAAPLQAPGHSGFTTWAGLTSVSSPCSSRLAAAPSHLTAPRTLPSCTLRGPPRLVHAGSDLPKGLVPSFQPPSTSSVQAAPSPGLRDTSFSAPTSYFVLYTLGMTNVFKHGSRSLSCPAPLKVLIAPEELVLNPSHSSQGLARSPFS